MSGPLLSKRYAGKGAAGYEIFRAQNDLLASGISSGTFLPQHEKELTFKPFFQGYKKRLSLTAPFLLFF
jgi:hypothetical protein